MSEQKIQEMIKKVNKRKTEIAGLNGELNQVTKQMEEEGCKTIDELDKEINKEERRLNNLSNELEKQIKELETQYDWS